MYKSVLIAIAVFSTAYGVEIICDNPNEVYQCGSACQTTCENLGQPCPIINIRCNDACYCVDGYARDANGVCIPQAECPKPMSSESLESRDLDSADDDSADGDSIHDSADGDSIHDDSVQVDSVHDSVDSVHDSTDVDSVHESIDDNTSEALIQ